MRREKNDDQSNFLRFAEPRAERCRQCCRFSGFTADKLAIPVAFSIDQTRATTLTRRFRRPLPDEQTQALEALLPRRQQLVEMLTAEKNRRTYTAVSTSIFAGWKASQISITNWAPRFAKLLCGGNVMSCFVP